MRRFVLFLTVLLLTGPLGAQEPRPAPGSDPIAESLFPPELLMRYGDEIGLTEDQKHFVITEVQRAQARATEVGWDLQREMTAMAALLKQDQVDEAKLLAQLDSLLAREREVKRAQFTLLIRILNRLTPQQRSRLRDLKGSAR